MDFGSPAVSLLFASRKSAGFFVISRPIAHLRDQVVRLILALLLLFVGCTRQQHPAPQNRLTHRVVDEAGRTVTVPEKIARLVSLAPNLTEIVFAVGAGDRLVGDTDYCDYPAPARSIAKIGDTLHPSIERIIALKPQLVLVSTAS